MDNIHARSPEHQSRLYAALRLETATILWMIVEAGGSIAAGILARSGLLIAFGVDSLIELLSAAVLLRRLKEDDNAGPGDGSRIERLERSTALFSGYLLYTLAVYVVAQSGYGLLHHGGAETSWWGMAITVVAAIGMPLLAKAKIRIAGEIGSAALRADAVESLTCGNLSRIALAGLIATAVFHLWWLDSAAALVLVPYLIKEGRHAVSGECACADEY